VGCATGKATRQLARRGFRITCVELGAELAAAARANLAGSGVEVVQGQFEEWRPAEPASLMYAATAWHWIDPAVRYQRAWQALRPGGHLATWAAEHVFPEGGDPFFAEIQDVYDEIGDALPTGAIRPRPGELTDDRADIEVSGLFEVTGVRRYDWERIYRADEYSSCSAPSLAIWPWPTGSGSASTPRSGGGWRCARSIRCGGTGERCCRWRGAGTDG
jgi:SAM-dependent methyltransferase